MPNPSDLTLRRAKRLHQEVQRLLKKHRKKLQDEQIKTIEELLVALAQRIKDNPDKPGALVKDVQELENEAGKAFAPYRKSVVREYGESIFIAVAIALLLRTFIVEPFKIPSGSMIPTLAIGDHIFVNKTSYGIWIPFLNKKWRLYGTPKRGDVIVFIYPAEKRTNFLFDNRKDYIKRVIGLPGDKIEVRAGQVYVNNKPIPRKRNGTHTYKELEGPQTWSPKQGEIFVETIKKRAYTTLADKSEGGNYNNWTSKENGPISRRPWGPTVKPGHVFVMGDNRDHSSDSRDWGLVPMSNIKGRAFLIWYSHDGSANSIRWKRIFSSIH